MKKAFVIGDVHGHYNRLARLLWQQGIIDDSGNKNKDIAVIQLGDLGHFGRGGDPNGDTRCWQKASQWLDIVLWGNHDRAIMDAHHMFNGYEPNEAVKYEMNSLEREGKLKYAHAYGDFLLTHAGLHPFYAKGMENTDPYTIAEVLNSGNPDIDGAVNNISPIRGGWSASIPGGILWRDASEKLHRGVRQIFGHSSNEKFPRQYHSDKGWSYCIDVGTKTNERLGGVWLPEEEFVELDSSSSRYNPQDQGRQESQ